MGCYPQLSLRFNNHHAPRMAQFTRYKTMITFASFKYPKKIWTLPKGNLQHRLIESKKPKYTGGYYQSEPCPNNTGKSFYLKSDFMPALRWNYCDEIANIKHMGWFIDDFCDEKIRGIVMRLPKSRGFIAGWTMGEGMVSAIEYYIFNDEKSAAYAADSMAQYAAEKERDYQYELQHEDQDNESNN